MHTETRVYLDERVLDGAANRRSPAADFVGGRSTVIKQQTGHGQKFAAL